MSRKRITSLILITTFISLIFPAYNVFSQEEIKRPTAPEKECEELKPTFSVMYTDLQMRLIDEPDFEYNYSDFQNAFDEANEKYHKYVECIFNYAEKTILGNVGLSKGTIQANTPNIDWMDPQAACLTSDKLKEIKKNTEPNQLLAPLLDIQKEYADHLDNLVKFYQEQGKETGTGEDAIYTTGVEQALIKISAQGAIERQAKAEKEMSLVSMNMAFNELKELRLSFFMHVQFQCMLNNLEKYRKWLGDIRTMVEGLPTMLEDASMTK